MEMAITAAATQRMNNVEDEEQEALFSEYPCGSTAPYYVQSPSTASHVNSVVDDGRMINPVVVLDPASAFLSPGPPFPHHHHDGSGSREAALLLASRFSTLSRYSSSRGSSNNSSLLMLQEKEAPAAAKATGYGVGEHDVAEKKGVGRHRRLVIVEDGDGAAAERSGVWRFLSLDPSAPFCCVAFQVAWRLMISLGVALLVFYLVTRPPHPNVSVKISAVREFDLREGLDSTGVVTQILTCNCSLEMTVDNHSKVFSLHLRPPSMLIAFGRLNIALSEAEGPYCVKAGSSSTLLLHVGTKDKPLYGAGGGMSDVLGSGGGLPLVVRVWSSSSYRVVWDLIRPRFRHAVECFLLLDGAYDERRGSRVYKSSCTTTSVHDRA